MSSRTRPSVVNLDAPNEDYHYSEEPMPVDGQHWHACVNVVTPLRAWLRAKPGGARTWVSTHREILYNQGGDCHGVIPDIAVYFGVDVAEHERREFYSVWKTGVAPAWILEVAMRHPDYHDQMKYDSDRPSGFANPYLAGDHHIFAALGVAEYWRTDPTGHNILTPPLQGYQQADGQWHPIPVADEADTLRGHSDVLGLDVCQRDGELRLYDPTADRWLPTYDELLTAHIDAEARAVAAEARADQQAATAAAAGARAERAEAELAALRRGAS